MTPDIETEDEEAQDHDVENCGGGATSDEWVPGTAGNTTSTVEVSISFRNLEDRDTFSKSDPMCIVYHKPPGCKSWVPLLRTELIMNDLDPDFATKLTMEYKFEQLQALRFQPYDVDSALSIVTESDSLGHVEVSLGQIVSAGEEGLTMELSGVRSKDPDKPISTIILIAEEMTSEKEEVTLRLGGYSVGKWSGFLPPKTYFMMSKLTNAEKFLVVHRSTACRGSNPIWAPLRISCQSLCGGDFDRELKVDIFQTMFSGILVPIGSVLLTLNKILSLGPKEKIPLMSSEGQTIPSFIRIVSCTISQMHTFIEYIRASQIHCCFSIDFTCSNGDPKDPVSLHYLGSSSGPNLYEQAIQAVGHVLQDYDNTGDVRSTLTGGLYPTWGFGARLPPEGELSYNFCVNLTDSPNCGSITGVLEAYRQCLGQIQLYGPTYFAPVIKIVAEAASKSKPGENYYILVIITDGVITDMDETKKVIVDSSGLPLSIIIIGIGEAEFDSMEELDGDAVRLSYKGKRAVRDIVQFIAYRSARHWMSATGESTIKDNNSSYGQPPQELKTAPEPLTPEEREAERVTRLLESQLAQEVLAEIPSQLTSYMRSKGIVPSMIERPLHLPPPPISLPPSPAPAPAPAQVEEEEKNITEMPLKEKNITEIPLKEKKIETISKAPQSQSNICPICQLKVNMSKDSSSIKSETEDSDDG